MREPYSMSDKEYLKQIVELESAIATLHAKLAERERELALVNQRHANQRHSIEKYQQQLASAEERLRRGLLVCDDQRLRHQHELDELNRLYPKGSRYNDVERARLQTINEIKVILEAALSKPTP